MLRYSPIRVSVFIRGFKLIRANPCPSVFLNFARLAITRASAFLASMRLPGLRSLGVGDRVGREPINIRVYPCFEKCFARIQNIPETIITPINAAATPASLAVYVPRKAYIAETVAFPSNSPHATLLKESFFIPA